MLNDNSKMQTTKEMSISCIWNVQSIFISFLLFLCCCAVRYFIHYATFRFRIRAQSSKRQIGGFRDASVLNGFANALQLSHPYKYSERESQLTSRVCIDFRFPISSSGWLANNVPQRLFIVIGIFDGTRNGNVNRRKRKKKSINKCPNGKFLACG